MAAGPFGLPCWRAAPYLFISGTPGAQQRLSASFLSRAESLAEQDQHLEAAEEVWRYLKLNPNDSEARARVAEYHFESIQSSTSRSGVRRAIELHSEAIALLEDGPAKDQLQLQLANLQFTSGLYNDAFEQAWQLADHADMGPEAIKTAGLSAFNQMVLENPATEMEFTVGQLLRRALDSNPGDGELAHALASTYRRFPDQLGQDQASTYDSPDRRIARANAIMDQVVAAAPSKETYLERYRYRREYELPAAEEDLKSAIRLGEDDALLHLELSGFLTQQANALESPEGKKAILQDVEASARRAMELEPGLIPSYEILGNALAQLGRPDEAIAAWEQGLAKADQTNGFSYGIYFKLIQQLIDQRELERPQKYLAELEAMFRKDVDAQRIVARDRVRVEQSLETARGILAMAEGKTNEAIRAFRRVVATDLDESDLKVAAWTRLGQCYEQLGLYDVAAESFGRASLERPNDSEYWQLASQQWIRSGQYSQALPYLRKLANLEPSAENWLNLAIGLNAVEANKIERLRNPIPVAQALNKATDLIDSAPDVVAWKIQLMQVVLRAATREDSAAEDYRAELKQMEQSLPDDLQAMQQLMFAYESIGDSESADAIRANAVSQRAPTRDRFMAESRLLIRRGELDRAIQLLENARSQVAEAERIELEFAIVDARLLRDGDMAAALAQLDQFRSQHDDGMRILQRMAQLSVDSGVVSPEQTDWERDLKSLEGGEGQWSTYLEIKRLLMQATREEPAKRRNMLETAQLRHGDLKQQRPLWPPTWCLAGEIAALNDNSAASRRQAIPLYLRAIELGERRPQEILKLVYLLYRDKQFSRAEEFLPLLGKLQFSQAGYALSQDVMVNTSQFDRAEALARRMVETSGDEVMPRFGLAQVLINQNKLDEAEKWLNDIVEAEGELVDVALLSLLTIHTRQQDETKAFETRNRIHQQVSNLTPAQIAFLDAQIHDALLNPEAGEFYRKAVDAEPNNSAYCRLSAFYFAKTGQMDDAILFARKAHRVVGSDPNETLPLLVTLLAERGKVNDWKEIDQLKGQLTGSAFRNPALDRLYAMIYALKSATTNSDKRKNLQGALKLLQDIGEDVAAGSADNHIALARIYRQLSEIESDENNRTNYSWQTRNQFQKALDAPDVSAGQMRLVADYFLEQNLFEESEQLITQIEERDMRDIGYPSLATISLKVRLLQGDSRTTQARAALEQYADERSARMSDDRRRDFYLALGDVCLQAEMFADATKWFSAGDNGDLDILRKWVLALQRSGNVEEAIRLCQQKYIEPAGNQTDRNNNVFVIHLVCSLLSLPGTSESHIASAESLLESASAQFMDNATVVNAIATLRLVEGKEDVAATLFRQAVDLDPDNPMYLNNLATTLSHDPDQSTEALEFIDRAIAARGQAIPELLDTKAAILIHKDPAAAESIWREIHNDRADPRITFQLADALYRQGKHTESEKYLNMAIERGLLRQILTPYQLKRLETIRPQAATSSHSGN